MRIAIFQAMLPLILLLASAKADAQPTNCYVQLDEASGFDVSSYQGELNSAACDLAVSFPDSIENQFKVFSFGFYLNLEFYDEYSYPQAFEDMSAAVAQQSPYYLLIGRQSDYSGVFTRFWLDLKLPSTGIFSCATEEQLEALKTRLLVAIEHDYFKNGKLAPEYAQAEMKGMEALKEHVLSLYECCDPQNRGVGTCDDCASFATLANFLELVGYSRTEFPNGLAYTLSDEDDGYLKQNVEINITKDGVNHDFNQDIRRYLDSLNAIFEPIKAEIQMYNTTSCISLFMEQQIPMEDEYLKFRIILAFDENNAPNLFVNYRFKLPPSTHKRVLVSLPYSGHGLNLNTLKNEVIHFIGLGGCAPEVIVKSKLQSLDWKNDDFGIIVGKNAKERIRKNVLFEGYCDYISTSFIGKINQWAELKGLNGMSDASTSGGAGINKVAVIDIQGLDPTMYRLTSSQIEKTTAFIVYHELGHLTVHTGHPGGPFSPEGFMDIPSGIFHVLGTGTQLSSHPEWYNLYESLDDLITDPKKKFTDSTRSRCKKICEKIN